MLKFLYTTDLHGNIPMYEAVFKTALEKDIKLIHLGADLLPKGPRMLELQKDFIKKYLSEFYARCNKENIKVLAFFGNDDIYTRKKYFKEFGTLLDEVPFRAIQYEFKAYPFVQDYKFGLKTACKWDSKDWRCPDEYIHNPQDFDMKGHPYVITDVEKYFSSKGTIEDDLNKIDVTPDTIMAIHNPPTNLKLDVCRPVKFNSDHWVWVSSKTRKVGSQAIYNWIEKKQPLLVLSGHIHENYRATGKWKGNIGKTLVIQPGQCFPVENRVRCIIININDRDVNASLLEVPEK